MNIDTTNESNLNLDTVIKKFDENGNLLWQTKYGGNSIDIFFEVIRSYNNNGIHDGYLILGATLSDDIKDVKPGYIIVKYDLNGNYKWTKNTDNIINIITTDIADVKAPRMVVGYNEKTLEAYLEDGSNFQVTLENAYINDAFFSKNVDGVTDGIIVVGTTAYEYYYSKNINGNYGSEERFADALLRKMNINNARPVIAKYDLNGNILWEKITNDLLGAYYSGMLLEDANNRLVGYLVVGSTAPNYTETKNATIIAYDLDGSILWEDRFIQAEGGDYTDLTKSYNSKGEFNGYTVVGTNQENRIFSQPQNFNGNSKMTSQLSTKFMTAICDEKSVYAKYTFKEYPIIKKETNEGTITVDDKAHEGTVIKLDVKAKEGYYLRKVTIKDENGNEIEVKNDNTFVMPKGKVTVEAVFAKIINPETASTISIGLIVAIALSLAIYLTTKKKQAPEI